MRTAKKDLNISPRELETLKVLDRNIKEKKVIPSIREIGEELNVTSTSTVHGFLSGLCCKGILTRDCNKARTLVITEKGRNILKEETENND